MYIHTYLHYVSNCKKKYERTKKINKCMRQNMYAKANGTMAFITCRKKKVIIIIKTLLIWYNV